MLGGVRENVTDRQTRFSMSVEFESGLREITNGPAVGTDDVLSGKFFAVVFGERGFGVEGIHLTGATVHEKKDAVFGLGFDLRGFGSQWMGGSLRGRIEKPVTAE
jgi:hypothetical protein